MISSMKYLLSILALAAALAAVLGVEIMLARRNPPPAYQNPGPEPQLFGSGPQLRYVVMGDSTAAGQGADYSQGIAVLTAEHLGQDYQVEMINLSVSGAKIRDVLQEQLAKAVELKPDLVLVSVGANDVTNLTKPKQAKSELAEIVRRLQGAGAKVVITGAPDMGSIPRFAQPLRFLAGKLTERLNKQLYALADELGVELVPIALETGPRFRQHPELYEADQFHPDADGYAVWVESLNKGLTRAVGR